MSRQLKELTKSGVDNLGCNHQINNYQHSGIKQPSK